MPTPEHMRAAVLKYFASFAAADVDAIVGLFADDAVIQDPIDGPPIKGHAAIRNFFTSGFDYVGGGYQFLPEGAVRIAGGNFAACAAIATCDKADPPFRLDTMDVMEFDAAGKIISMKAYWGPANMQTLGGDTDGGAAAAERAKAFVASMAN